LASWREIPYVTPRRKGAKVASLGVFASWREIPYVTPRRKGCFSWRLGVKFLITDKDDCPPAMLHPRRRVIQADTPQTPRKKLLPLCYHAVTIAVTSSCYAGKTSSQ
jgi:hypothetical protein